MHVTNFLLTRNRATCTYTYSVPSIEFFILVFYNYRTCSHVLHIVRTVQL